MALICFLQAFNNCIGPYISVKIQIYNMSLNTNVKYYNAKIIRISVYVIDIYKK